MSIQYFENIMILISIF